MYLKKCLHDYNKKYSSQFWTSVLKVEDISLSLLEKEFRVVITLDFWKICGLMTGHLNCLRNITLSEAIDKGGVGSDSEELYIGSFRIYGIVENII